MPYKLDNSIIQTSKILLKHSHLTQNAIYYLKHFTSERLTFEGKNWLFKHCQWQKILCWLIHKVKSTAKIISILFVFGFLICASVLYAKMFQELQYAQSFKSLGELVERPVLATRECLITVFSQQNVKRWRKVDKKQNLLHSS